MAGGLSLERRERYDTSRNNLCTIFPSLDELGKISTPPQFGPDEVVDGKDCKVVDVAADPVHQAGSVTPPGPFPA